MSLISILAELKRAQRAAYAVPHFDVFDLAQAEGVFAALVETARAGEPSYFDLGKAATEACRARCAYYVDLFGAANRA